MKNAGLIKKGQTVLISVASGVTGFMAVQLAKQVFGSARVIDIASSDDKCHWVDSLPADYCIGLN